ncbi:hypothetical protein ACVR0O_09855 [Streptococcus caviae]|uniref:hypothetical protein n=1 Tax=Streptococcus sp. 'caviae' TaxID=1915004 RepID=UPI00115610D4|nr:hypothetical protein [Streptococcus sp. 'caviae']
MYHLAGKRKRQKSASAKNLKSSAKKERPLLKGKNLSPFDPKTASSISGLSLVRELGGLMLIKESYPEVLAVCSQTRFPTSQELLKWLKKL